jgi:hypothetical protein
VAGGTAESVEHRNDYHRDSYDEEGVLSRILAGLLAPESFEGSQHDEHLELQGTKLGLDSYGKFSAFCEAAQDDEPGQSSDRRVT